MKDSDRDITISGVLFLVAAKSFELSYSLMRSGFMKNCAGLERFANSLIMIVLISATAISALLSFWYFKEFSQQFCHDMGLT